LLLNNVDWFGSMSLLPFLRDVGRHFRLGTMLGKESVSSRMKASSSSANGAESQGMSFTEFCYQVLQGYDFLHLHRERQCSIQVGGSDQWGNITAGVELAQRDFAASPAAASNSNSQPPQVFGLTLPLLTTADGQKFGKSTGAPIWLAAPPKSSGNGGAQHSQSQPQQQQCSSPYELYQFFLTRTADADLGRFLRLFTDYSLDQIRAWEAEYLHCSAPNPKALARILAEAVTTLVHGAEGLKEAQRATAALFGDGESGGNSGGGNAEQLSALSFDEFQRVFAGVPSVRLGRSSLESSPPLLTELCVLLGAAKTKAEAKRLLAGGGLYLNGSKLLAPVSPSSDAHTTTTAARRLDPQTDLLHQGRALILRAGKKKQFVLFVEDDDKGNASATKSHA
jgi:tyrosyl-tRNA synthetase